MQRRPAYWCTSFGRFVSGYTVRALVRDLAAAGAPVDLRTVYHWLSGRSQPRLGMAQKIVNLSAGALTLEDVCAQRKEVQARDAAPMRVADYPRTRAPRFSSR